MFKYAPPPLNFGTASSCVKSWNKHYMTGAEELQNIFSDLEELAISIHSTMFLGLSALKRH